MSDIEWNAYSRLDQLLKVFGVSGKDLSKIIHVDEALISKWRRGKRALKSGSVSAEKIAEYFISIDRQNNFSKLKKLLSVNYKDTPFSSESEISVYLKTWLSGLGGGEDEDIAFESLRNNPDVAITISYHFKKNSGRRAAVRFFNEYAETHQNSTEIVIFTTEDGSWFYEDDEFRANWKEQYFTLLNMGMIVKIIHPVNRSYHDTANSIVSWLPLHLTGKTADYYIPNYTDDPIHYTYFLIPGQLVLIGSSSKNYTKNIDTWITNDEKVLSNSSKIMQEYLNRSKPLFSRYYMDSREQYTNELIGIIQRRNTRFFYSTIPQYVPLSDELLEEIFIQSNLNLEEGAIKKSIETYKLLARLNMNIPSRYIISLQSLKHSLLCDKIELHIMSYLSGFEVIINQELYRKIVKESFKSIEDKSFVEIGLFIDANDDFEDISVLAQENTGVQFFGNRISHPFVMILHETTFIVAVMEHIKTIWKGIPAIMKDKEYIYQQIEEQLNSD